MTEDGDEENKLKNSKDSLYHHNNSEEFEEIQGELNEERSETKLEDENNEIKDEEI